MFKTSLFRARILLFPLICLFTNHLAFAQEEEEENEVPKVELSGFIDFYFGYDFNEPEEKRRLPFLYNHTYHNSPTVNIALIKASYEGDWFRASLGLQQGTYVENNLERESEFAEWFNEAKIGIALTKDRNLWLDVGIIPSHLGAGSYISSINPTLSRSLMTEGTPYFLTGGTLGWQASDQVFVAVYVTNGWQLIRGLPGNTLPSFGTQIVWSPSENTSINWSTFTGPSGPDEDRQMRYFSDLYATLNLGTKWMMLLAFDAGTQNNSVTIGGSEGWYGAAWILQRKLAEKWNAAVRAEYFHDPFGIIAINQNEDGLKSSGFSLNLDRSFGPGFLLRAEGRWLLSPDNQFIKEGSPVSDNFFLLTSLAWTWN